MFTTKAGKELHLGVDPKSPLLTFRWAGGGELPQALCGLFTGEEMAKKAFNMWQANKEPEVEIKEDKQLNFTLEDKEESLFTKAMKHVVS